MPSDQIISVDVDTSRLNAVLVDLREALIGQGQDISTILVDEQRLLTRTIVNFTPPIPAKQARQRGELAVQKDLYSLINEADARTIDRIGSKYGLKDIDTWRTTPGGRQHIIWENLNPNGSNLADLHNSYRYPGTGRPKRMKGLSPTEWHARIVVEKGVRQSYVDKVKSHVGRWKAKWAYAAAQLGDNKYPQWITRHFGYVASHSFFQADLASETPFILFGGRGPNFSQDKAKIQGAVAFRVRTILKRIQIVVSRYAKNVADGVRIQTQAHKHKPEAEETVD